MRLFSIVITAQYAPSSYIVINIHDHLFIHLIFQNLLKIVIIKRYNKIWYLRQQISNRVFSPPINSNSIFNAIRSFGLTFYNAAFAFPRLRLDLLIDSPASASIFIFWLTRESADFWFSQSAGLKYHFSNSKIKIFEEGCI